MRHVMLAAWRSIAIKHGAINMHGMAQYIKQNSGMTKAAGVAAYGENNRSVGNMAWRVIISSKKQHQ